MNSIRINGEGPFSQDSSGVVMDPGRWDPELEEPLALRDYNGLRSSQAYQDLQEYRAFVQAFNQSEARYRMLKKVVVVVSLIAFACICYAVAVGISMS